MHTYDTIGSGYNSTRKADPYLTERLLYHLQPQKEKRYLDIGCGTGNYTAALADLGYDLVGVEPSERMLHEARSRSKAVNWLQGSAEKIPAADGSFDGAIATLTIHHWSDPGKAFAEIDRVLCHGGRMVLFTSTPEQMKRYWLNHYFPQMLHASVTQMPALTDIEKAIAGTALKIATVEKYFVKDDLQDGFLYIGKNAPERYFDEAVRHGISSFSSLANAVEVESGLAQLRADIDSGAFEKVKAGYENETGDYLFVVLEKE